MNNATEDGKAVRMKCEKVNIRIGLQSRGNVYKENTKHDKHREIMYSVHRMTWKMKTKSAHLHWQKRELVSDYI